MGSYKELNVWKSGKCLAVEVYRVTASGPIERDFGLRDQIRRSAVSVPSNIAEGEARKSDNDSIRFFHIAMGSLAELATQVEIATEIGYFEFESIGSTLKDIESLQASLGALIRSRKDAIG